MRATRLERLGLFKVIHPDQFTELSLRDAVSHSLRIGHPPSATASPDMGGLDTVCDHVQQLLNDHDSGGWKKLHLERDRGSAGPRDNDQSVANVLEMPLTRAQQ